MNKARRRTDGISYRNHDESWYSSVSGEYLPLRDAEGRKIKGRENEAAAKTSYARLVLMLPKDRTEAVKGNPTGEHVPLKLLFSNYLDYLEAESVTTFFDNKRYLKEFLAFSEAETIGQLDHGHVRAYLATKKTWNDNTCGKVVGVLRTAIQHNIENFGKRLGIKSNPLDSYRRPTQSTRITYLTPQQEEKVMATAKKPFREYLWFLIHTGARPGEAMRMTKDHIHETPKGLKVVFRASIGKQKYGHKAGKKTGKDRVIYLSPEVEKLIREKVKLYPTGPLLRTKRGLKWTETNMTNMWLKIRETCGIPDDIVIYSCRHTFATRMYQKTKDIKVVASLLGNSVQVCIKHYVHGHEDTLWDALQ